MPEALKQSSGDHPVTLENEWDTVEAFLKDLGAALEAEARVVRETELDQVGGYQPARFYIDTLGPGPEDVTVETDGSQFYNQNVFVDRLGRAILPGLDKNKKVIAMQFDGSAKQKVLNKEPRYHGKELVAWVLYLEPLEETDA